MYTREFRRRACEAGYHDFGISGPKATARRSGFGDPKIAWCWYTGAEAARSGQSLKAAYATLDMKHG